MSDATPPPAHRMRRWAWRAAGLPTGAVVALVFPRAGWWWFAWVALVPTMLLVATATDRRDAAWRSWAAGTGASLGIYHWLLGVMGPFVPFPALLLGGSWAVLGLSQWQVPPVRQLAALGGVWALSWLLVAANVGVSVAVLGRSRRAAWVVGLAVPAALGVATVGWGAARSVPEPTGELRVAGIQPGLIRGPERRLAANEELTGTLGTPAEDVELIVWGQSSVGFDPAGDEQVRARLEEVAATAGTSLLVNVDARRADGRIAKSTELIDPDDGIVATYDKQRLVPFGEYVPLRGVFGWLDRFTEAADEDRVRGGGLTVFDIDGTAVGPLISYESTFPDLRRSLARLGPDVVVVQGATTTFQGSWVQTQQAAYEAIRTVESGRPSVLVAVSGTSAAFDATGRRLAWLPSDRTGVLRVDLPVGAVDTPYVRWGDWVPLVSLVVVLGWLAAGTSALVSRARDRR